MKPAASNVTELLAAWRVGDRAALEKVVTCSTQSCGSRGST
jgi:hypothetical protein